MTPLAGRTLLVVDDDDVFRERVMRALGMRGLEVTGAADLPAALDAARQDTPELALVDLRLPGGTGLDLVRALGELDPSTIIVVLTGYGSIATAVAAIKLGAVSYLTKPADADQIVAAFSGHLPDDGGDVPSLARVEWEHIQRVMTDTGGNISESARRLGIHRRSLQRKLSRTPVTR